MSADVKREAEEREESSKRVSFKRQIKELECYKEEWDG